MFDEPVNCPVCGHPMADDIGEPGHSCIKNLQAEVRRARATASSLGYTNPEYVSLIETHHRRFASGNGVPVDSVRLSREEFEILAGRDHAAPLDQRMRQAGMFTLDEMTYGAGRDNSPFEAHAGVRSLDAYREWLESKVREYLMLQADIILRNGEDDELFEWAVAHAAAYRHALCNFRAATTDEPEHTPPDSNAEVRPEYRQLA